MLIKTIENKEYGKKWEIYKQSATNYIYKYYEYFKSIGWKLIGISENYSKDCIEWELETEL